jgi:hypothetical protein
MGIAVGQDDPVAFSVPSVMKDSYPVLKFGEVADQVFAGGSRFIEKLKILLIGQWDQMPFNGFALVFQQRQMGILIVGKC